MTLKMCHLQKILSGFLKYLCKSETEMDQVLILVNTCILYQWKILLVWPFDICRIDHFLSTLVCPLKTSKHVCLTSSDALDMSQNTGTNLTSFPWIRFEMKYYKFRQADWLYPLGWKPDWLLERNLYVIITYLKWFLSIIL